MISLQDIPRIPVTMLVPWPRLSINQVRIILIKIINLLILTYAFQTVKQTLQTKWKDELNPQKPKTKQEPVLPPFNEKLLNSLANYIGYCCRFSWRVVTQLPPLKIAYQGHKYDPRHHIESQCSPRNKKSTSPQIRCFLWPILLDSDGTVLVRGEVALYQKILKSRIYGKEGQFLNFCVDHM